MGRKKMGETEFFDNIGEKVDLEICPNCNVHSDCFSNINGKCVALKECGGLGCVFYKNRDLAVAENKATYKKLRKSGKSDLILKYGSVLSAVGAFDDDVTESKATAKAFENYQEEDYQKRAAALKDSENYSHLVEEIQSEEETKYQRLVEAYQSAETDPEDENEEEGC